MRDSTHNDEEDNLLATDYLLWPKQPRHVLNDSHLAFVKERK